MNKTVIFLYISAAFFLSGDLLLAQEESAKPSFSKVVVEAFTQEGAKNYAQAYELYTQALTLRDDSPTVWIRRAFTASMLGKTAEVGEDLKVGMTKAPISVADYLTVAWFRGTAPFNSLRDGALAVTYAQKVLRESESIEAYDALAAGYAEMGNFTQARKMAMQGIKRFPASPRLKAMQERVALYNEKKTFSEVWGTGDAQAQKEILQSLREE
jgi:tetratricopeptide (TPR) repeat protein